MTPEERRRLLDILSTNIGFDNPEAWLTYASSHGFQRVSAVQLTRCPDCQSPPGRSYGRYVYYSTLMQLIECDNCGLIWVDARLDDAIVRRHFESAYKDTSYFANHRRPIFRQIASLVAARAPQGGSVLDVGGATGELLVMIRELRPDLRLVLNDLSESACELASARLGIETRCCDLLSLPSADTHYDAVVCSDVLYYETQIRLVWPALRHLVGDGGSLIIRLPNKAQAIAAGHLWRSLRRRLGGQTTDPATSKIAFFNPEHLYVFRRAYVERRLRQAGFERVEAFPSHPLGGSAIKSLLANSLDRAASLMYRLSARQLIVTPSMLVIASR
jgi:SAM-dependent methyltransferase